MADRSVKVTLRAEVADFTRQIGSAAKSLDELTAKGDKTGQTAQTTLGRMAQSMQLQREAWTTAGTAMLGVGTAITGVGAAALATGVSYNTLQQTSRAALTTLTGNAEAANAQMDRLDEFASTSPFAKDVFIRAQQQMLGFGIEAQKVIPYLDSIQNAVAATGGSNQDIAELSLIMSQISAAGKITGQDLMQFAQRGVDAATLIGSQMGMTGAQIREEITAGSLDAGTALDALAAGMQETYGGAADNVKNTFVGAWDRVKAAWRDLSSELAAPLVGPEGGGLLTGLLNQTADLMRAFQGLPGPVKGTVTALGGLAGAGTLAGGAFLLLAPKALDAAEAFTTLKPRWDDLAASAPRLAGGLGFVGKAMTGLLVAGAVAQGIGAIYRHFQDAGMGAQELENRLISLGDSADPIRTVFGDLFPPEQLARGDEFRAGLERMADPSIWDRLRNGVASVAEFFGGELGDSGMEQTAQRLDEIGQSLAGLATTDLPQAQAAFAALWEEAGGDAEAAALLLDTMPAYRDALSGVATELGLTADESTLLALATGELTPEIQAAMSASAELAAEEERLAGLTATTTEEIREQVAGLQSLYDMMRESGNEFMSLQDAQAAWGETMNGLADRMEEFEEASGSALNEAADDWDYMTERGQLAWQMTRDVAQAGLDVVDRMREAGESTADMEAKIQETRDEVIDLAMNLGMGRDAAEEMADRMGLIPDNVSLVIDAEGDAVVAQRLALLRDQILRMPDGEITVNGETAPAEDALNEIVETINTAPGGIVEINGDIFPVEEALGEVERLVALGVDDIEIGADFRLAGHELSGFLNRVETTEPVAMVAADTSLAMGAVNDFVTVAKGTTGEATLTAYNGPAMDATSLWLQGANNTTGTAGLNAEDRGASGHLARTLSTMNSSVGTAGINAQDRGAARALSGVLGQINSSTGYVGIGARVLGGSVGAAIGSIVAQANAASATVRVGAAQARASGGEVWGAGTSTSDSIPALLSNGEFVVRTAAADHYGRSLLHAINSMSLPKGLPAYATGGQVGRVEHVRSAAGTSTVVQQVPVPTRLTVVDSDGVLQGTMRVAAHAEDRAYERVGGIW